MVPNFTIIFVVLALQATMPHADVVPQEDALLRFKQSLSNATALVSWDPLTPPCDGRKNNWVGLICSRGGNVYGLRLEIMGLSGNIDVGALATMHKLRILSFMNNKLDGPIPNVNNLRALKTVYLSNNMFQGAIEPQFFVGMERLRKLHLSNNNFTGPIPVSLTKLPKLIELRLDGNHFQGKIPNFNLTTFNDLSLANNNLEGRIPASLSRLSPPTFAGNKALCGMPLKSCETAKSPAVDESERKKSIPTIPIAGAVLLLLILLVVSKTIKKRSRRRKPRIKAQAIDLAPEKVGAVALEARKGGEAARLCFVREDGERFDLPDLLRASAEVLGSGCFGSSYKASLGSGGSMVVVKRFKQMNDVRKEEFHEHMRKIGRLQHKNVVSLVAYYYRKEEKLLVSNFVPRRSLASHLHGKHEDGEATLDWATRLNIIKGVSRGLAYIYKELALLIAPHGHLKSSNVLMDESFNPLIHDYGLIPLINKESAEQLMVAYKSPEYVSKGWIHMKTDVWALGILIIEILTGRFPSAYLQKGGPVDLSTWVKEAVGDRAKAFDKNMGGSTRDCEAQMHKLLDIGLACCESDVHKRWGIKDACDRIEELKERDN